MNNLIKLKRRNIFLVAVIAFVIMLAGEIIGTIVVSTIVRSFPHMSDGMFFTLSLYLTFIGSFILIPIYLLFIDKETFADLLPAGRTVKISVPKPGVATGLKGNTVKMFLLGLLIGGGTNFLCLVPALIAGDVRLVKGEVEWGVMIVALLCVFIQSSAEEFMMRYMVLGQLRRRYPMWLAIAFNAVFFMALHLGNPGVSVIAMLDIAVIGVSYSIAVCYLDSLWMPMAMHTAWNYMQNYVLGLPNSGLVSESSILKLDAARKSFFYDTAFGIEGTVIALVVDALLGVLIIVYVTKKGRKPADLRPRMEAVPQDALNTETTSKLYTAPAVSEPMDPAENPFTKAFVSEKPDEDKMNG